MSSFLRKLGQSGWEPVAIMACTITFAERVGYLHVLVRGDNAPETMQTYIREIPKACARFQQFRVLIVMELSGPEPSMLDVYKCVTKGSDRAAGLGTKIAYVDEDPTHSIDNMLLAENIARGRGIAVKTFRDWQTAELWLLSDSYFE